MTNMTPQLGDVVIFEAKDGHPETRYPIIREARSGPLNWRFFTLRNDSDKKYPTFVAIAQALTGRRFVRNGQEGVYA